MIGEVPVTFALPTLRTVLSASTTWSERVYSLEKCSQEKSARRLVFASARPAGLYQMAPRSSAPATNAPARPIGLTPRSEK